ncbi:MAG: Peptide chain release factor 2 [Parcubacteria group bacterium GW2011_GWA2_42_11]|nr:MAG: Peptide chain release factor 2 [Parcubacteria group bacterium GW2011_GWA2_42_11]KKT76592.1 MAG: Peptide chain release factor 2 [Parcubacteria group bacterium GW2011_GWF2_44_7]
MAEKIKRIAVIEGQMADAAFWQEPEKATKLSQELSELKQEREKWEDIDLQLEMLAEEGAKIGDAVDNKKTEALEREYIKLEHEIKEEETKVFFSGPYDKNRAILSIYAGAGGTEAQDWSAMLLRMYARYAEKKGFKPKILHEHFGQEAGIKNATLKINAPYAYGYLKNESGVHRLVRLSPFNANNLRHTSFALVEVLPEIEEAGDIVIKPEDLKIDTFRSSGPGGQNVNKVETAVRLTHLPSNIVVAAQSERSQSANKEQAMKILVSKLYLLEQQKKAAEIGGLRSEIQSGKGTAEWGSQIRNYVLHPYKLIKDLRTGVQSGEPEQVLDGDLDEFIEAEIKGI